ncbi:consortin, connexin sorting protein b isoform X2 [Nerophis ophidion]|uniref:consortin, connexin sorting protein b isoform X2 n=1 Tax=Nerophis ophidion TaxID=159077 RepID=UPI002ADF4C4B|nr:consortin, connexin sorting protein b isoform X2 [Nerophis ophidion]
MKEQLAQVTQVMWNDKVSPPDTGQDDIGIDISNVTGSVSACAASSLSPQLLASLQALGDNADLTLLPHSLHQIAEACSLQEDYQLALQLLQLEKTYHQRVLHNLRALEDKWESQWKEKNPDYSLPTETDDSQEHMTTLRHLCRTHLKPSLSGAKKPLNITLADLCNKASQQGAGDEEGRMESKSAGPKGGDVKQEDKAVEEEEEEDEEEEVKVEWPTGVPQASDKDLAKLCIGDTSLSPDGLVSILKRRRASLDGLPPPGDTDTSINPKRKVRFSEPEDASEQDEMAGDSCLTLMLLCLVTMVISVGGTALYCFLVDEHANICSDLALNVDFLVGHVRVFFEQLPHWRPHAT